MKKQIKKLNLSKRTISNLDATEMSNHLGGFNANARMKAAAKATVYQKQKMLVFLVKNNLGKPELFEVWNFYQIKNLF